MPFENLKGLEMQTIYNGGLDKCSIHSTSSCVKSHGLWSNSSGSHVSQSSYSKEVNMNMESLVQHANQTNHLERQMPDQESSSTGQSYQEAAGESGSNYSDQCVSAQSGDGLYDKRNEAHMKSDLSLGSSDVVLAPPKLDCSQSIACIPYSYADPYYVSIMAACGSHAVMHPQIMGMVSSARVPPTSEHVDEGPIYVNPKQYHRILQRRQHRAKLEAENKFTKNRKPYLHESRHRHATKRPRGSGGRFLNTKQLQQSQPSSIKNMQPATGSDLLRLSGGVGNLFGSEIVPDNGNIGSSATPSCSDVTSASNSGAMLQLHQHHGFSYAADIKPHTGGSGQGGGRTIVSIPPNRPPDAR